MSIGFKLRKIYRVGYCLAPGAIAQKNAPWKRMRFIARSFLIEHPQKGLILIDTGYGKGYFEATKRGWGWVYNKLLPVTLPKEEKLIQQLKEDGISIKDLSYLILTHFHPDHIGALKEFINVPWIYRSDMLTHLFELSPRKQIRNGFMQDLVPNIPKRSIGVTRSSFNQKWKNFLAFDVFKDGSLILVDLPGHADGQMGVKIQECVFAADAIWNEESPPHPFGIFLQENKKAYQQTASNLLSLSKNYEIIPTHTMEPHE